MEATTETPNPDTVSTKTVIRPDTSKMVKGARGTMHKGDFVGHALDGLSVDEALAVAAKVGLGDKVEKNRHLNPGQQRMCIGGSLRALAKIEGGEDKITAAVSEVKAERPPEPAKPAPAVDPDTPEDEEDAD